MRIGTRNCWDWGKAQDTLNICCMLVTLDVSRLSGWLNTESCRFEMGRVRDRGGRGAGRDTQLLGLGQGAGHLKHLLDARDTGRVETQRLVEHRALPIRNGARTIEGGEVRVGTRNCWDWGKAQDTLNICCMLVTLDVSRLSGWLNTEPCRFEMGRVR